MHSIQQKLLKLAETYNIGNMSFREVARIIGAEHPQLVKHHLEQLEKKELIKWDREKKEIQKNVSGIVSNIDFMVVPVLGSANCGLADIYADESIQGHIKVSSGLVGNKSRIFAIQAVGHSMNRANICGKAIEDGDYVLVDPSDKNVRTNDYVLSVIDEVANIKKIVIDNEHSQITLKSESSFQYPDIFISVDEASRYIMNGKIIQVIKQVKAE